MTDQTKPQVTQFLIMTTGRTGSSHLLSLLQSHPEIRHWGEIIGGWHLKQEGVKPRMNQHGPVAYIISCYESDVDDLAIGMKIHYHQFRTAYGLNVGVKELSQIRQFFLSNKQIKIIHLKRHNKLRMLVSKKIAETTDQWQLYKESRRSACVSVHLSPQECNRAFKKNSRQEEHYDQLFQDHDLLEVYYENLVSDQTAVCNRILNFLQVPLQPLQSHLLLQNTRALPEVIDNYLQLKDAFKDTPWALYFED